MNKQIFKIGFYILLIINISLIAFLAIRPKPPGNQGGIRDKISIELGFSETQDAKFEQMIVEHREAMRTLEGEERNLVKRLFDQLSEENTSLDREVAFQKIGAIQQSKIKVTYQHFEELKSICTPEQLQNFEEVLKRVVPLLTSSTERPQGPPNRPR